MSFNFETGEVTELKVETMQANKRMRDSGDVSTFLALPVVPVYFPSGDLQATFEAVQLDYDKYRCLAEKRDVAEKLEAADGVDLDALLEEDLQWGLTRVLVK